MVVDCILLIVGIVLLIKGADFFVSGASEIAKALKIPPLVIGLTLVSMGTSMPEASVSVIGAINGMNDMSVGNVVGSNIFNTLLIIGVSALITPIVIGKDVKIYDIPAMLGMYAVLLVFSFAISPYRLETFEAVILLLLFAAYTAFLIIRARKDAAAKAPRAKALPLSPCERFKPPLSRSMLFVIAGLLGIVLGGDFVVDGASSLAKAWGMSESLVGLTIVAAGTSLPELVTSAVASVKKENDIAVGNVIGSNIFNVVFILGLSSAISAPTLAATALVDMLVMLGAGVALAAVALLCKKAGRLAGAAFTAMYFGYLAYIIVRNSQSAASEGAARHQLNGEKIMSGTAIAVSILTLVAGVGVFLIACGMMSSNLESLGSKRLKSLFAKTTGKKLVGVGVGAAATAAIQSSSATTVMVIGFVNAGIMTLTQAATVIFGANIGTTITGQLVALGMFGNSAISSSVVFAALAGIGAFMLAFAKRDRVRKVGGILAGFGMIFVGLSLMSGAMESFAANDGVRDFLATFKNPFLLVLIGALLTAVVQSSSVMTSMAITMTVTGLISLNQGVYITMGSNIGTCVTALIAGIASGRNAKRAALIHFIFNVSGVIIFLLVGMFMRLGGTDYGHVFQKIFPGVPQTQLAMFHTVFNVATVILILPLTNLLVKLVTKIIPDKKTEIDKDAPRLRYLDEHMLATPPIAVQQTKNEVVAMAQTAFDNFVLSCEIASTLDFARVEEFRANEKALNYLNRNITAFTVKLLKCELDERDRTYLTTVFKAVTDLERIGDYAENIVEYAEKLRDGGERFSEDAVTEIAALRVLVQSLYDSALKAYVGADKQALANAYVTEESIDDMTDKLSENHIARLSSGACTPDVGALFLMLTSNVERIADHLINVAKAAQYGGK